MLIVHITLPFSVLTEINFMDSELNICHATVRDLFIVCNTTTGPVLCSLISNHILILMPLTDRLFAEHQHLFQ